MIEDLLTVRGLQELLHVDRTTIYRMIRENRLPAFKVGGQWRFARRETEAWLAEQQPSRGEDGVARERPPLASDQVLPLHCLQPIQNVLAEALEISAVTTDPNGAPVTDPSAQCEFCRLVTASAEGRRRCIASCRSLGRRSAPAPFLAKCHAGLRHARGQVRVGGENVAWVIAGQFLLAGDDLDRDRVAALAADCGIGQEELLRASTKTRVVQTAEAAKVLRLLQVVADTFSAIGEERCGLVTRLRRISEMSML